MDKHMQVAQLCLPLLSPKDLAVLRCVCSGYQTLRVSWEAYGDIYFTMDGSPSAICWLHKNIVSIKTLYLTVTFNPPQQLLQGLIAASRTLTHLCIKSQHIKELPRLPAHLQYLQVSNCKSLRSLPELPPTLEWLHCDGCAALTELPSSLSSTAVADLNCNGCARLQRLPALPDTLDDLEAECCHALTELPELPAGITSLKCESCRGLRQLPELAHTQLGFLDISACKLLREIPELPDTMDSLHASHLPNVTQLPALSHGYTWISIDHTGITELPDPLPYIGDLYCSKVPIQRLPAMAGCRELHLDGCRQLQQLPEQLPKGLYLLDISECTALHQLPAQLPARLSRLFMAGCTALQQLPAQLPASLEYLNCEGCSSLQQLPDLAGSRLRELRVKGCVQLEGVRMGGAGGVLVRFN